MHSCTTDKGESIAVGFYASFGGGAIGVPRIGRILRLAQGKNRKIYAKLEMCLRPEELEAGRQPFFGERELIQTDIVDWEAVSNCIGAVNVHSLAGFQKLKQVQPWDHFSRFSLKLYERKFFPETIKVFCTCNMPYNPDLYMAECTDCHEWYHPECVGADPEEIEAGEEDFLCDVCREREHGEPSQQQGEEAVGAI